MALDSKQTLLGSLEKPSPLEKSTNASVQEDICGPRATQSPEAALRLRADNGSKRGLRTFGDVHKPPDEQAARVAISSRGRIVFVDLGEVRTVVAQGNWVLLQHEGGSCRHRGSISVLAEKLEPYGFVRIHRSVMVNRRWVEEILPSRTGGHVLQLKGGKEFRVTRSYRKNLKGLAALWLGTEAFLRSAVTQ